VLSQLTVSTPLPTTGVTVQLLQPVPLIAVAVRPVGNVSVTVVVPVVVALPELVTVIV
jgi:hypothetical protein